MILKTTRRQTVQPIREKQVDEFSLHQILEIKCIYSAAVAANHVEELSEHIQRDKKLSRAAPSEKRRDGEAGADGGEVVLGVHRTAIRQV